MVALENRNDFSQKILSVKHTKHINLQRSTINLACSADLIKQHWLSVNFTNVFLNKTIQFLVTVRHNFIWHMKQCSQLECTMQKQTKKITKK